MKTTNKKILKKNNLRKTKSLIRLPNNYKPNDKEIFMNDKQLLYFKNKLETWRESVIKDSEKTRGNLQNNSSPEADIADRASTETDRSLELRTRDRQRKLLSKIDAALIRIKEGSYGFCIETGEPISLKRLDARPIAILSIAAQERHEKTERSYKED